MLFVDNPNVDFHGAHVDGTSVLNVNSDFSFTQVFWHETAHWLKATNPELYRRLVKAAGITDVQRKNYLEETKRKDLTTDAAIDEEIIADQLEDVLKRAGFLRDIGRKDQSLIERVIAWLQDLMSKFREYFQNPKGKLTREQAQRMANEFGRMAKTIVNRDGKAIFRYNNKTHSVELATGESLDKLYDTAQREISESNEAAQTKKAADKGANSEYERLQTLKPIFVETGIAKNASTGKGIQSAINAFIEKYPNGAIVDTKIGKVTVNKKSIKNTLSHLIYPAKIDSVLSLPEGLKIAAYMESSRDFSGKDITNHFLIYPIEYEGEKRFVFCRVRETPNSQNLYVHGVYSEEEINAKSDAFLQTQSPTDTQGQMGGIALYDTIIAKFFAEGKREDNAALVKNFGGRIENGRAVFDNATDEADYRRYVENLTGGNVKYSIAGDNSNASSIDKLKNKIKNVFTEVKNERTRNHMRKLLEKLSGYRIRTGRFAKGIAEVADDVAKVIRSRSAYDWEKILPAVGKSVATQLNLDTSDKMSNYIAGWFIDGAPNDNSTEAQEFQRAMREADDMYRHQLLEVCEIFEEWNNRTPEEIVRDTIAHGKTEKPLTDKAKGFFNSGYGQLVEELYPIKQLVDAFEEELGRKLTDDENPYVLLRNYRGMAGRAKIMVEEGAAAIKALKAALPNVNFDNFKTIRMILESVGALADEEKRKQFSDFLLACSVKDLHNLNNANLKAQTKLERTIERLEDAMDASNDSEERADFKKQIKTRKAQLENLKSQIYATPFDEKTCDGTIAHYKKIYGAAQQDMVKFQNTLLDIMVDSGLLSKDSRDEYLTRYPNHVPMFRQFDENENVSFGDSLKMMTGSTRDVIDPLESIVRNTYSFIRRAEKNKAKLALVNLSRVGGAGEIFDEISKPNGATHTSITFYEIDYG